MADYSLGDLVGGLLVVGPSGDIWRVERVAGPVILLYLETAQNTKMAVEIEWLTGKLLFNYIADAEAYAATIPRYTVSIKGDPDVAYYNPRKHP